MRWSVGGKLPNIKAVMDRYNVLNQMVERNRTKMRASGAPCTYWRNSALTSMGETPAGLTKCYCWATPTGADSQQSAPDRKHFLCMGTGYLQGYQKYGYQEIVVSTPSTLTSSSKNVVISGERNSSFGISGNSILETLTTERFALTRFLDVAYFLINDIVDPNQNRIEYYYSVDETNWVRIAISDYTASPIANKQGALSLPAGTSHIRFRITFKKKVVTATSPKWNSIRFRYRNGLTLHAIDPHFNINIPSFLASREAQKKTVEGGEHGWVTRFPVEWWVMPDADVKFLDIIMFVQGAYSDYRFVIDNVREFVYGENLQLLHKTFESKFIRDYQDLVGITHLLL